MSKTRRPIGMRADVAAYDPREDRHVEGGTMGRVAFFEYREDALAVGREWVETQGYQIRAQYFGRYDLWALEARRKSWRGAGIWVEVCRNPDAVVIKHAHVPMRYSYARIAQGRTA